MFEKKESKAIEALAFYQKSQIIKKITKETNHSRKAEFKIFSPRFKNARGSTHDHPPSEFTKSLDIIGKRS